MQFPRTLFIKKKYNTHGGEAALPPSTQVSIIVEYFLSMKHEKYPTTNDNYYYMFYHLFEENKRYKGLL